MQNSNINSNRIMDGIHMNLKRVDKALLVSFVNNVILNYDWILKKKLNENYLNI